jgi:hypothetical protein
VSGALLGVLLGLVLVVLALVGLVLIGAVHNLDRIATALERANEPLEPGWLPPTPRAEWREP